MLGVERWPAIGCYDRILKCITNLIECWIKEKQNISRGSSEVYFHLESSYNIICLSPQRHPLKAESILPNSATTKKVVIFASWESVELLVQTDPCIRQCADDTYTECEIQGRPSQ